MICKECGNKQDEGKFCGLCGGALIPRQENLNLQEEVEQEKEDSIKGSTAEAERPKEASRGPSSSLSSAGRSPRGVQCSRRSYSFKS